MTMDGVKEKQDVKTSADQKQTSVVTEEQAQERERKARSDALAEAGRYKAEAEKASRSAQASLERLTRLEQERIEAELEAHKDDPAEIKRIRAEQRASKLEADLAKEREAKTEYETRLQAIEKESAERNKTSISATVAKKFNVDADKLSTLAKLTDGSEKAIEALAEALPKTSTNFKPDSNRGVGGMLTWEEIRAAYISDPYNPTNRQRYEEMRGTHSVVRK